MTQATLILVLIALILTAIAWRQSTQKLKLGVQIGWSTLKRTLPVLLLAFLIVGFVNALEPQSIVRAWIGPNSGMRGVLIGTLAGMLLPGGPYVVFPLIGTLYQSGAGLGPTLAMITSWATLALLTVSFELPFMGWRFSLIRLGLGLLVPLLVGAAGTWL
ncbi:MAG: permease [Anaerolineales bacterium]|jgi:uncharacterized membrane protein YraQ (UPF0718 family)